MGTLFLHGALMWCVFLVLAICNGVARVKLTEPRLGSAAAHRVHTLVLVVLFFVLTVPFVRYEGVRDGGALAVLGLCWAAATFVFECWFGRRQGLSWSEIFSDYNVLRGRLWPLVLVGLAVSPWLAMHVS